MIDYSDLLIKIRAKLNVSQEKLAIKLGVSFATINRWEKEHFEPTMMHKQKILDLCKELKIAVDDKRRNRQLYVK